MADSSFEAICQPTPHSMRSASTNGFDTRYTHEDRATPTWYRYATTPRPVNEHYSGLDRRMRALIGQAEMRTNSRRVGPTAGRYPAGGGSPVEEAGGTSLIAASSRPRHSSGSPTTLEKLPAIRWMSRSPTS